MQGVLDGAGSNPGGVLYFFPENFRLIELCRLEYLRVVFWTSLIVVYNFERRVIDYVPTKATIINYIEFFLLNERYWAVISVRTSIIP